MKKRFLSWLLVLTMVISLIPSTLVTALAAELPSVQAATSTNGKTTLKLTNTWPTDEQLAQNDIVDVSITSSVAPGAAVTVKDGQTLIFHGTGFLANSSTDLTPLVVESGGHLVLDELTIQNNGVASTGAVYVKNGGLLDLGYNDRSSRHAPSITSNTVNSTARNLVIEDGATVRLNAAATNKIGIYYGNDLGAPFAIVQSGRYTLQNTDLSDAAIYSDHADYVLSINYGDIYVLRKTPKVLLIDPGARATSTINGVVGQGSYVFRQGHASSLVSNLRVAVQDTFNGTHNATIKNPISAIVDYKEYQSPEGTDYKNGTYSFDDINNIMQYDVILINGAWGNLTADGRKELIDYLNAGGGIYFQAEDTQAGFDGVRAATNVWMHHLGAADFAAMGSPSGAGNLAAWKDKSTDYAKRLTENMPDNWHVEWTAPIKTGDRIEPLFWATFEGGSKNMWAASYLAGEREDGAKYGRLIAITDGNWVSPATGGDNRYRGDIAGQFFTNLLRTTRENRITAAAGYNPNAEVTYEATTTATNYRTPYAALQKAVEGNTVTLLTKSNTTVTPTRNELLFEQSTLAYETGSKYDGSKIYADKAGVYLDITKTGEVNLRSVTVTVTPKDKNYVLTMNGTMDETGTQITGGYKITSATKYQLIADDPTSPILPQNGGKASIVIPNVGESVTVDYGGGKTVTYTAKTANDKIYLGWYQVKKQTPANMTWTDADKAWHGHTFTTTLEPNVGYEINGENLTIADTDNAMTGGYTLKKQGDAAADPNDNTISWTTYSTDDGKVTVKQQHLHSGGSDRNGIAILTVQDVHADISIGAGNNTVNAKAPTIYVVGIGKRTGHADVQLWEYTTIRNTKDGILDKPVSGWPWEKWKVSSAASGNGTESDYKQNKVTLTSDTSKLDTSSETAAYTIDLRTGDKVVVFYYDWNMTTVTIKAVDANNKPIPDYTDQVVEYEIGKQTTITAPNLIGYQPVGGQNTKDFTPSETNKEITFQYEKTTGNLIYKAVYVDAAGATNDLGTFSGGTLVKGQAPNKSAQYAPRFDNYELADKNADGVASAESYTGTDITVTYTYKAKVKTIPVEAYVDSTNGVRLLNDTTTYKDITTGQTITVTAPDIAGYKVKGAASQTVFVTNDTGDGQKVVFLYEKDDDNDAYVLVKLVDSSNSDKLISSYQVPGVKDKAQLIKAPAAPYGYKNDPAHPNEDKTVTPTGTQAPYKAEVVFKYVPNVHTVTIELKDVSETPAKPLTVNNYVTSYKVVDSEGLTITAPSIYGYTMAKNSASVKVLSNITKDETVTFEYEPIDKQMVYIHVKGVGPDGKTLFESNESVTHGTASKEVNVFTLPGLKLASATVGSVDKTNEVANGKLTVNLTSVTKGGTVEVLLTYESNMANVTVKAMYNGQPLQSYTTSLEKGIEATINAPSVPGYTADKASKPVKPGDTETENTVTFIYTKNVGNITVIVTENGTELYRQDGGTVEKGKKIELTGDAAAPTVQYYTTPTAPKSVMVGSTDVKDDLANYKYDGNGDIVVTYEYTRKTQDVTIIKKNVVTGAVIDRQTLTGLEVGKSHTFTDGSVTVPNNYQAVTDRNPTSYFVEDKPNQTVTFYYKNTSADQYTQITVNLICGGKVFQSYPVTAIKGQPTTILAPTWNGYTFAGTEASKTVTPDGTPDNDKVEFEYTITNPKTVEVVLKDNSNSANPNLNAPANYTSNYTLKKGDNVTIWAPAIDGYSLVSATLGTNPADSSNKQMVQVSYDALANSNTTVTFAYMPVSQADFVKHTVNFVLTLPGGTEQPLYTHEKLIPKGTGNQVVYKEDDVKYTVPGYAYQGISYKVGSNSVNAADVKDNVNATITYRFTEASAWIKINQECVGGSAAANPAHNATQTLTGYREGQENVVIIAPVLKDHALKSDQPMSYTFSKLTTGENEHTFQYVKAGDTRFVLKEIGTDKIIAVLNAETGKNYSNPNDTDSPLNLSAIGYTYTPDKNASEPFRPGATGTVDTSRPGEYTVYYEKMTRQVEFVAVDKTKLDAQNKKLDDVIKNDTVSDYTISGLKPVTPEDARVGESYKAVAQSFDSWALKDDYSKYYEVPVGTDPLKVYFMYVPKTTGTVTVHYHFGTETEKGETLNEYTITAVAGENLKISAPEYLLNNKYHLRGGQTNPYHLTVTQSPETVDFYYEANFVVVTAKTVVDSGNATTHETYEVIKDLTTHSGSTTLYPPEKAGYTLVGITATGATLTSGGADKLPTQYTNNKLALTGLTQDATVTYYYKTTKASEYQTELTVEYKYNGYDLAALKTIKANTGEANSIDIPAFDGYTASTYVFKDGNGAGTSSGVTGATATVTPAEKTATLTITYTRPDGSVVLPGKDNVFASPKDQDNVTVTPTDPTKVPTDTGDGSGSVKVPDDTTATVTRPTDPEHPEQGSENITVPGGSVIKPDGTIVLPNPDGGEIGPNGKIPENLPSGYVAITYDSNNGSGDVKKEIGKKGELKVAGSLFTHPTNAKFEGWNDSGLGSGTAYAKDKTVNTSITLYAKWSANYKYLATITYKPNDGTTGKDVFQNVGHDTDPNLKATLQSSPFQVSGWLFGGWNEEADGTGELRQPNNTWNLSDKDAKTLYAQWYKLNADGSITVPGKDGNPNHKETNATANGNGNVTPKLNPTRNDKGEIEVPKGGSVTLPDGSVIGMPDGGKLLPNGTVIINRPDTDKDGKSDGTITIPGKTDPTKPDVTDKNNQPEADAKVIELVYQINNGETVPDVTVKVVSGDSVSILSNQFTWTGYQFVNWMGTDDKVYAPGDNYVAGDQNLELHAQWSKQNTNGSIELPGKDGSMTTPKDNVLVTPDNHPVGNLEKKDDGSVEVKGDGATVNRPKDPDHPDQGKENIKVPEGTIVKPDGTIVLPNGGGTIKPGDKLPDATPTGYISVVYKANGGTGDDVIDLIKNDQTTINARTNPFTNGSQTFTGWNTADNGVGGTLYQATDTITVPAGENSVTLYAQWGKANFAHSTTITYLPNDGTGDTNKKVVTVGSNTDANFKANLLDTNPFSVTGWTFGGWHTVSNGVGSNPKQLGAEIDATAGTPQTWYAQWYRVNADGSITVPGEDGNPNMPGDNVTANGTGVTRDPDTGNISIPAGGNVVKGNETIALPDGGTLKPDGTLIINKPTGGDKIEVKPDGTTDNANVVTLTYRANDGTDKHTTVYATKGEAIAPLAANTFSYSGHRFLYWQSGNDTYTADAGTITPTEAMTLFAVWAKVNPDGSVELPGQNGKLPAPDDEDNVIVTPDKPNGTLDGPKDDGSVKVETGGATVTRPDPANPDKKEDIKVPEGTIVKPDGTIVLPEPKPTGTTVNPGDKFPDTTANYVTVTLLAGTGNGNTIKKVVTTGSTVILTDENRFTAPAGEFFVGWRDSNGSFFDPDDSYTANTAETFTAQYKANAELTKAIAVFDYAGGVDTQGNGSKSITGKATTAIPNSDVTTPTRDGYTFNGWDKTLNFGEIGTVTVFTAQWSKQTYTVTFEAGTDGTMTGDDTAQVDYNGSVPADKIPAVNANAGKVFIGWLNGSDHSVYTKESLANYKVTDNVTFTAQYVDDSDAIVIFDYDGGTADGKYSSYRTGTPDSKIDATGAIPTPNRPGFSFTGWNQPIDENTVFGAAGTITVYKAGWNADTKQKFTVTFDIDSTKGSTTDATIEQVEDGSFVTNVPTVTAIPGYSFVGWKDPNGKLFYEAGIQHYRITGETKFTAEFVEISVTPDKATVIFDANGGRIGGSSVLTKDGIPGTVIGVPAEPVRPGYTFVGWSDGFDANTTYGAKGTAVTYTAQWQAIAYTIHFSATGASGATADQTYQFDGTTSNTLNRNGFSMSGKQFLGWSLTDGASTADYADGALINTTLQNAMANSNGSITLYAVWKDNGSTGGGSSGGGSSGGGGGTVSSSFTIKASAGNGGIISPSGNVTVSRGKDQSFSINPVNGYRISDVIVDGKSVGTVSTYTFDSVKANHTIEVKFTKLNSIVADPEVTGVAGWLQTREHVAYLGGYGNGLFGPNDNMTRAQAARMFYNLLLVKDVPVTTTFTDVPADAWYAEAVNTLASLGIIAGIGNNQFAPNRTITRAEFAVIAMRFANLSADVTNPFSDVSENDWFYSAVTSAVSYGWIGGYSDGTFRPRATITRAEVATIVNRMLARTADRNFVDSSAVTQFVDVPSNYWAYYNIMEATNAHTHTIDNDGVESWTKLK